MHARCGQTGGEMAALLLHLRHRGRLAILGSLSPAANRRPPPPAPATSAYVPRRTQLSYCSAGAAAPPPPPAHFVHNHHHHLFPPAREAQAHTIAADRRPQAADAGRRSRSSKGSLHACPPPTDRQQTACDMAALFWLRLRDRARLTFLASRQSRSQQPPSAPPTAYVSRLKLPLLRNSHLTGRHKRIIAADSRLQPHVEYVGAKAKGVPS